MTAKKVWGTILVVLGVIVTLAGLYAMYMVYQQSVQLEAMSQMIGDDGMNMFGSMGLNQEAIKTGYIRTSILTIVGIVLSVFGTKLLQKKAE